MKLKLTGLIGTLLFFSACAHSPLSRDQLSGRWLTVDGEVVEMVEFQSDEQVKGTRLAGVFLPKPGRSIDKHQYRLDDKLLAIYQYRFELKPRDADTLSVQQVPQRPAPWTYYRSEHDLAQLGQLIRELTEAAGEGALEDVRGIVTRSDAKAFRAFLKTQAPWVAYTAAAQGHDEIFDYLVEHTLDPQSIDEDMVKMLVQTGHHRSLIRLTEKGMDINRADFSGLKDNGLSLLNLAAREGDIELMELLVERGADLQHKTKAGNGIYQDVMSCKLVCRKGYQNAANLKQYLDSMYINTDRMIAEQ